METVDLLDDDDVFNIMATTTAESVAVDFLSIASSLVISRNETANSSVGTVVSNFNSNVRHLNASVQVGLVHKFSILGRIVVVASRSLFIETFKLLEHTVPPTVF